MSAERRYRRAAVIGLRNRHRREWLWRWLPRRTGFCTCGEPLTSGECPTLTWGLAFWTDR